MFGLFEKKKICHKCNKEIYLTSIERRYYRENGKQIPALCWLCNRRENAAKIPADVLELRQGNERL